MTSVSFLIDSDVLIDHLRGFKPARDFLSALVLDGATLHFSVISEAEIFSNVRFGEERQIQALFDSLDRLVIDGPTARQAGRYRSAFRGSYQLALPDTLIAATAQVRGATLVTRNVRHYPMADIEVIEPYTFP